MEGETETGEEYSSRGQKPWKTFPVEEQMFAVLARLRLGLKAEDVCDRTGLVPSTFSKMFATWVVFLALELPLLFPWPSRKVIDVTMPPCFVKYPSTRVMIDCMEMQVQRPASLLQQSRDVLTVQEPQHIQSACWDISVWTDHFSATALGRTCV